MEFAEYQQGATWPLSAMQDPLGTKMTPSSIPLFDTRAIGVVLCPTCSFFGSWHNMYIRDPMLGIQQKVNHRTKGCVTRPRNYQRLTCKLSQWHSRVRGSKKMEACKFRGWSQNSQPLRLAPSRPSWLVGPGATAKHAAPRSEDEVSGSLYRFWALL